MDFKSEEYFIFDLNKIQVYSFSGKWKRTLKVPEGTRYETLYDYNERYLICENTFHDYWNVENLPVDETPFYLIDKLTGKHIPIPITIEKRVSRTLEKRIEHISDKIAKRHFERMSNITPLLSNGHEFLISDFSLDTIYSYKNDILTPIAVQSPAVHSGSIPLIVAPIYYTDDFLIFKPIWMEFVPDYMYELYYKTHNLMWDRKTNKIYQVKLYDHNRPNKTIKAWMLGTQFESANYMFNYFGAEYLCDELENLKGELKEVASRLKEDDNNVLAIYKLK